jgi:L-2-hydroxyglutarate oxidase LhgO
VPEGALTPAFAGVRPKITAPGEPAADFRIDDAAVHGCAALVNLFGIESPGLTASLALAREVAARIS